MRYYYHDYQMSAACTGQNLTLTSLLQKRPRRDSNFSENTTPEILTARIIKTCLSQQPIRKSASYRRRTANLRSGLPGGCSRRGRCSCRQRHRSSADTTLHDICPHSGRRCEAPSPLQHIATAVPPVNQTFKTNTCKVPWIADIRRYI